MKKLLLVLVLAVVGGVASLSIIAWRYEARVRRNVTVGFVPVGGLTPVEAAKKLRIWWLNEKGKTLDLRNELFGDRKLQVKLSELGIKLNDEASVRQLPTEDFWDNAKTAVAREEPPTQRFEPIFESASGGLKPLAKMVAEAVGDKRPARARLVGGAIVREPEVAGYELDSANAVKALVDGLMLEKPVEVPIVQAPKSVPDEELAKITDVVSEFSTRFPRSKVSRNSNIRTASSKLDGVVLAPGERLSFNETVGQRTIDNGFKLAGVYKNGKHDLGIGGGICQVSSTLYNAALLSNLKIVRRQNHSMPVAYLPVGRDATVNYGAIDLVFENTMSTPIAVSSSYTPGRLTFRILGKKDPSISVKIIEVGHKSWDTGVKTVKDATVPAGKKVVIEKGSRGHSVTTYRIVYKNGIQIARQSLGRSFYRGGVRIVAVGTKGANARQPVASGSPAPGPATPIGDPDR